MSKKALGLFKLVTLGIVCLLFVSKVCVAQVTTVHGKVTDARTGEPIPFASVYFKGTGVGTNSNFEGAFSIRISAKVDSVSFSFLGYKSVTKAITPATSQVLNVSLEISSVGLQEVVVRAGKYENPAYAIIRKTVTNKQKNDKRYLQAYEYENYNKVELDISHLSAQLKKQKLVKTIVASLDSTTKVTDSKGDPALPVFISETLSKIYYRGSPRVRKEEIFSTNVKGVGLQDSEIISQLLGSSLQDYNFYEDWMSFLDRKIVSPVAHSWKLYYDYELQDSMYIGNDYCYEIAVKPKREQDLAFEGTIWITKSEYALKQVNVRIGKKANLNFVDELHVQQQLIKTNVGNWLPEKTRVVVAGQPFLHTDTGFLLKFYTSIKDPVLNQVKESKFYEQQLEITPKVATATPEFWKMHRHDTLSFSEVGVMRMIDSVNANPRIKRTVALLKALGSGYIDLGKVDIGPYPLFYIYNNYEKSRYGFGLRTNKQFSDRLQLYSFIAYGTGDKKLKHNLSGTYILSRKSWTVASIEVNKDIEQLGLNPDEVRQNYLFYASSKWGELEDPYRYTNNGLSLQTDLWKGITLKTNFRQRGFEPLFPFTYNSEPNSPNLLLKSDFNTTEVGAVLRLSRGEKFMMVNYDRVSLRNSKWPALTLSYTYGLKGVLDGDFDYQKLGATLEQRIRLGVLGTTRYTINGGAILKPLPYPLLYVHTGNESFFYTSAAYSLMNYQEFVSDRFMSLRYQHNFDGLILNSIPGISKLNWRLLAQAIVLYGDLSEQNKAMINFESGSTAELALSSLSHKPYLEVGYGIENIFRFFRVDAFHRLTYLDRADVRPFGVKMSAQFKL